jgi:hypothetical protein
VPISKKANGDSAACSQDVLILVEKNSDNQAILGLKQEHNLEITPSAFKVASTT